ncbi:MAG: hypothetical protein J0M33_04500 [Anaerolineae bacterium]|jgi:hypothetical protein|nr:hypothetical protein [Anaerolineae bacterium]
MATTSRSWFYTTPDARPYMIEERVNHSLWKNRLQGLYMSCVHPFSPIRMEGDWNGMPVQFEFQPGQYFILRSGREVRELIGVLRQVLLMRPTVSYVDATGFHVVEWHTDSGAERLHQIQSNNANQSVRLLKKPSA